MPEYNFFEPGLKDRLSYQDWDKEFDMMKSKEGISALSVTLLQQGCKITPYKNTGVLFRRSLVDITDIFKADAGTSVEADGSVNAGDGVRCSTLDELKEFIHQDPRAVLRHPMNELKINTKINSLCGLFFEVAPDKSKDDYTMLKILIWQKHLKEKYNIDLPVFEYQSVNGELNPVDTSAEGLKRLSKVPPNPELAQEYRRLYQHINSK